MKLISLIDTSRNSVFNNITYMNKFINQGIILKELFLELVVY